MPDDQLSIQDMRRYLSKSLSSVNQNKLHGLLAEGSFRSHLGNLGFADRVSSGGWIVRCDARGDLRFAENAAVFFPETIFPNVSYGADRVLPRPHDGLHTVCATFHQIGIRSYSCAAEVQGVDDGGLPQVQWHAVQLGVPTAQEYRVFPDCLTGFTPRARRHGYLRYNADADVIPETEVPAEFSKENLRVGFSTRFYSEVSDLDGLFWGERNTYPVEIKEKTVAHDAARGDYFGLDVGPFVKLAYYAAKRGNLHSMFVVREIDNVADRNLVDWWYITFGQMAQYASWNFIPGGRNMQGGASATVPIPKAEFARLDANALATL